MVGHSRSVGSRADEPIVLPVFKESFAEQSVFQGKKDWLAQVNVAENVILGQSSVVDWKILCSLKGFKSLPCHSKLFLDRVGKVNEFTGFSFVLFQEENSELRHALMSHRQQRKRDASVQVHLWAQDVNL